MLLKSKMALTTSCLTLAFGVSTTAQANFEYGNPEAYSDNPYLSEQKAQQNIAKVREYRQKYDYKDMTNGLSLWENDEGVQKCLEWSSKADDSHPELHPEIEKALYHIASYGATNIKNNGGGPTSKGKYPKAFSFCDQIPRYQSQ